jgi:hypothetical protein
MLVFQIALGVFLGWLGIQAFQKFWNHADHRAVWSLVSKIIVYGILLGCILLFIFAFVAYQSEITDSLHRHAGAVLTTAGGIGLLGFAFALRSDLRAKARAKQIASESFCGHCGKQGLVFQGFHKGLEQGHRYPKASCPKCGREQLLSGA